MSSVVQIGDLGFGVLNEKPSTLAPPSLSDLWSLWGAYKTIAGAADAKVGLLAVIKGAGFRAQFKAFAKAVAALDALIDDPAKLAEAQAASASLLT